MITFKGLSSLVLFISLSINVFAQTHHEYAVRFDPQNVSYSRLNMFTPVNVDACTAYDKNGKRLFWQGKTSSTDWTLYTVNVLTGAIIYQSTPFTSGSYYITLMKYDNSTDTLYGIYQNGAFNQDSCFFCWIDPQTGAIHKKNYFPGIGYPATYECAFDELNHLFIFLAADTTNVKRIYVVDARTGNMLNNFVAGITISALNFNNTNGHLYAIADSATWQDIRLDTINLAAGTHHHLVSLGNHYTVSRRTSTIDEASGHFIYVASVYPQHDTIFTVDLQTNTIIDRKLFPFDPTGQQAAAENILGFNYDEGLNAIYAIHWGVDSLEAVNDLSGGTSFEMYPNPASQQTIIYPGKTYDESVVVVCNALGEIVLSQTSRNASAIELKTDALAAGIYYVSLTCDGEKRATKKLVIDKN